MAECPFPLKEKHWSRSAAVAHLISLRRKDGAFTVTAYKCTGTPTHWHVGHVASKPRRRRYR